MVDEALEAELDAALSEVDDNDDGVVDVGRGAIAVDRVSVGLFVIENCGLVFLVSPITTRILTLMTRYLESRR